MKITNFIDPEKMTNHPEEKNDLTAYMSAPRKTVCNICGKEFDEFDLNGGFSIHKRLGYGSPHDLDDLDLSVCCECLDRAIIAICKISPITPNDSPVNC